MTDDAVTMPRRSSAVVFGAIALTGPLPPVLGLFAVLGGSSSLGLLGVVAAQLWTVVCLALGITAVAVGVRGATRAHRRRWAVAGLALALGIVATVACGLEVAWVVSSVLRLRADS
jgi:hypothetical protein